MWMQIHLKLKKNIILKKYTAELEYSSKNQQWRLLIYMMLKYFCKIQNYISQMRKKAAKFFENLSEIVNAPD